MIADLTIPPWLQDYILGRKHNRKIILPSSLRHRKQKPIIPDNFKMPGSNCCNSFEKYRIPRHCDYGESVATAAYSGRFPNGMYPYYSDTAINIKNISTPPFTGVFQLINESNAVCKTGNVAVLGTDGKYYTNCMYFDMNDPEYIYNTTTGTFTPVNGPPIPAQVATCFVYDVDNPLSQIKRSDFIISNFTCANVIGNGCKPCTSAGLSNRNMNPVVVSGSAGNCADVCSLLYGDPLLVPPSISWFADGILSGPGDIGEGQRGSGIAGFLPDGRVIINCFWSWFIRCCNYPGLNSGYGVNVQIEYQKNRYLTIPSEPSEGYNVSLYTVGYPTPQYTTEFPYLGGFYGNYYTPGPLPFINSDGFFAGNVTLHSADIRDFGQPQTCTVSFTELGM